MNRILVIDDDKYLRDQIVDSLSGVDAVLETFSFGEEGVRALERSGADVVVVDPSSPTSDGIVLVNGILEAAPDAEVVVITRPDYIDLNQSLLRAGVHHLLFKPIDRNGLRTVVQQALALKVATERAGFSRDRRLLSVARRVMCATNEIGFYRAALMALISWSGAKCGLFWVYDRNQGAFLLGADIGLSPQKRLLLEAHFTSWYRENVKTARPLIVGGEGLPRGFAQGMLLPVIKDRTPRAFVALWTGQRPHWGEEMMPGLTLLQGVLLSAMSLLDPTRPADRTEEWDNLTLSLGLEGLRRALYNELKSRGSTRHPVSLLAIDVDHYKQINDDHGHVVGGQCLIEFAHLLRAKTRDADVIGRPRGDEFFVLLPNVDLPTAELVAERIRQSIEQHRFLAREGIHLVVTATIAVLDVPRETELYQDFLIRAEQALREVKRGGRNRVAQTRFSPE